MAQIEEVRSTEKTVSSILPDYGFQVSSDHIRPGYGMSQVSDEFMRGCLSSVNKERRRQAENNVPLPDDRRDAILSGDGDVNHYRRYREAQREAYQVTRRQIYNIKTD